ncbi:hypothetical protein CAI21_15650 [Alkalilimnicola ehrlichii]|uniref:Outer membrane protein beta-barrel domain-containing protein n=1 Tax=Alkalilimnicola ehrlichii TaxID=351052 RepID=A0A3E0WPM9_9GAMM|nr:porin family protein [Alkalilimnicola ehrlichii]RFA26991.1 hypothetical protein CAI21_15650 [Alkalilimnicola ehrlichii]RFA34111.1 hypothetical protein CAL65_15785 [Alkalilimnicola ehrlichii]
MTRIIATGVASALLLLSPMPAPAAQTGEVVGGGQLSLLLFKNDETGHEAESPMITYRLGYFMTPNISVEGRFGHGISNWRNNNADTTGNGTDDELELDRLFGIYLTAHQPLPSNNAVSLYGTVGVSDARMTESPLAESISARNRGASIGIGAEFIAYDGFRFNAEYMHYVSDSGNRLSAVSIGGLYAF